MPPGKVMIHKRDAAHEKVSSKMFRSTTFSMLQSFETASVSHVHFELNI